MKKLLLLTLLVFVNCYTTGKPYKYAREYSVMEPDFTETSPQFESGRPNVIIDGLGHYLFSLPVKLILWNWKMLNHDISEESKQYLKDYIRENNLKNVKVRFNQYDPGDELKRLMRNRDIHWSVRYTVGIFAWLAYTFIPDRLFAGIFGGDHYNPYSNTINVYSDLVPVLIHEGGHAKDTALRQKKNLYSLSYGFPLIPLYHEARASEDAYSWLENKKNREKQIEAYNQLSPAYGTYVGGELITNIAASLMVIPGHIYGRYKSSQLKNRFAAEDRMNSK